MMFDVGCLFGREEFEVTPNFGASVLVSTCITYQVEQYSVFDVKVCRVRMIFFLVNGSSPDLVNSFQYSMRVNSTAVGVVGSYCESNAISFSCSCFGRIFP